MPCETHQIYDKINSVLTGLHEKCKDHENLVTLRQKHLKKRENCLIA